MGHFSLVQVNQYVRLVLLFIGIYIGMQYVLPLVWPFLIGGIVAKCLYPITWKIARKTSIPMGVISMCIVGGSIVLLLTIVWLVGSRLLGHMQELMGYGDWIERHLMELMDATFVRVETIWGVEKEAIEGYVMNHVNIAIDHMQVNLMPHVMEESYGYVKWIFTTIATVVVTVVATLLIAKDYELMRSYAYRDGAIRSILGVVRKVGVVLRIFLKSQLIIMSIIIGICVVGFLFIEPSLAIYLGIITGLLDAIPFIGTGIILIPLAIIYGIEGQLAKAIGTIILYVVSSLVRDYLEPKLIGDRLGYLPIVILLTIYLGIQIYGVMGILLGPISFLLVNELNTLFEGKKHGNS